MPSVDLQALYEAYHSMETGDPKMRAIRTAITEAERAGEIGAALAFHLDLIRESVFSGDRYQALVDFPQYQYLLQTHPELQEKFATNTLWLFKWIVEASAEFPQIEKKQVLQWFNAFRKELRIHGYSLKPFYEKRANFFYYFDSAKMLLDYEDFLHAPHDDLSDGIASDYDSRVRWELRLGNREKAQEAMDYIQRNGLRSDEIPASTYGYFLRDAMAQQDFATAAKYATKLRPLCTGQRFRLEQIGLLLAYDAQTDPAAGLQYLAETRRLRVNSRNPLLTFWYDRGAAWVLHAAAKAGLATPETPDACLKSCTDLAARFDARNGSDYFAQQLDMLRREIQP